jgi:hypothetical protein
MNWADRRYSLGRGVCSIRGETALDAKFIKTAWIGSWMRFSNWPVEGPFRT